MSTSDIQKILTVAIVPILQSHTCSLISFIVVNVFENSWGCWARNARTTLGCRVLGAVMMKMHCD